MKHTRHTVTDHAVLRYLERVEGVDVEAVRRDIAVLVDEAVGKVDLPPPDAVLSGGFRFVIAPGQKVVTVYAAHKPCKRKGRGRP